MRRDSPIVQTEISDYIGWLRSTLADVEPFIPSHAEAMYYNRLYRIAHELSRQNFRIPRAKKAE